MSRQCSDCNLCCKLLGVKELDKPNNNRCVHQCKSGCKIYESRPQSCRDFECMWELGNVPEELKSNKVHAVIWESMDHRHIMVHLDPDYPISELIDRFVHHVSKTHKLVIIQGRRRKLMSQSYAVLNATDEELEAFLNNEDETLRKTIDKANGQ